MPRPHGTPSAAEPSAEAVARGGAKSADAAAAVKETRASAPTGVVSAADAGAAPLEIDLREPWIALILAWLLPGAGHLYQRRYAKAALFMVCILGTWFFGLALGGGHVVYASLPKEERRLHYFAQVLVGTPALPALVQTWRMKNEKPPLFGGFMAPPKSYRYGGEDELAQWHAEYHTLFELGTLYTVIAGLLNVLAMYDAFAGPAFAVKEEDAKGESPPGAPGDEKKKKPDR